MTTRVILINGASCSGKTTICKEICKQSNDKFVHLQVDEAKKYLSTTNFKIPSREIGRPICDEILLQTAKIFLKNDKNVIIDTIFNEQDDAIKLMRYHIDFFKDMKVLLVGIDCNIAERLRRFHAYNDNPVRSEREIISQSNVFELCREMYDVEFDTSKLSGEEVAREVLKRLNSST